MRPLLRIDFSQRLDRFGEVRLKIAPHDVQHLDQHGIAQRVEDLIAFPAIGDELAAAQNREVLGEVGLFDGQPFLDGAGRELSLAEDVNDGDASGMCEGLKYAGLVGPQEVLHYYFSIFDSSNLFKWRGPILRKLLISGILPLWWTAISPAFPCR